MKKIAVLLFIGVLLIACTNASKTNEVEDKEAIEKLLRKQAKDWSNNDLEGFMEGYWKSDSLKFYNSNGITFGWDKTLANYKKRYPSKEHSGSLKFTINDISKIENGAYYVMGAYQLTRTVGDAKGIFMIILKKINGEWKIVADTSCAPD